MKLYTVQIGDVGYRLTAGNVAQAVKMALVMHLGDGEEPKGLELSVKVSEVPKIEILPHNANPEPPKQ